MNGISNYGVETNFGVSLMTVLFIVICSLLLYKMTFYVFLVIYTLHDNFFSKFGQFATQRTRTSGMQSLIVIFLIYFLWYSILDNMHGFIRRVWISHGNQICLCGFVWSNGMEVLAHLAFFIRIKANICSEVSEYKKGFRRQGIVS